MTYQEVNPGEWKPTVDGSQIEGVYIKMQEDVGVNKSNLYSIETPTEGVVNVWGSAILDQRMGVIKVGSKVRITYKGLGEAKGGQNAPKLFKVEVDSDTSEA